MNLLTEASKEVEGNLGSLLFRSKEYGAIEPKEDMLIMFPAHLPHRVNQNLSEKDRISIAFNFSIEQVDNDK